MYVSDTIVAIATPPGEGGIGILRVSGPQAVEIATGIFIPSSPSPPRSHHLRRGSLHDAAGGVIDEALAVFMFAPHSYTGEDVVELHCHASPVLLRVALQRCAELGARPAEPGEFTKRAFLNGRIDLIQAEAVAEVISARTETAARVGLRHLSGTLSAELAEVRGNLISAKAHTEALIDFADEDLDLDPKTILVDLRQALTRIVRLLDTFRVGQLLRDGARVVIAGRPNVGKSSLLNALLGSERAIVTPMAGTTRDVIIESIELDGVPMVLADTAGLRSDPDEIERIGIERTRQQVTGADAVLVVLDRSRPLDADDQCAVSGIGQVPTLAVANKIDLPKAWDPGREAWLAGLPVVEVSARTGEGLDHLRRSLLELLRAEEIDPTVPVLTLARHRNALERASEAIRLACASAETGAPADVIAVDIQTAVEHIGGITGEITTEEILDHIFREFCIGK